VFRSAGLEQSGQLYIVSVYNSTSSLLANGTGINLFIDDIFSPILKCLQQQLDCIDIINADMKCALSKSTSDQSQVKNSRRNSRTEIDHWPEVMKLSYKG
jgi:hypothetical protein